MINTDAGKRLLLILPGPDAHGNGIDWQGRIAAIEAEAVAAERVRIKAVVREKADYEWDTTYSAEAGISVKKLLAWLGRNNHG